MKISIRDKTYEETSIITIPFSETLEREIDAFDLVLARRAVQDAIIERIRPDTDENVLESIVYVPMFEEELVLKFDPEGLMFFLLPLEKDYSGSYANVTHQVPVDFLEE